MNEDFEVISVYTQNQGVEDGFLADVSELAKEAGFCVPVHITTGVQGLCEVPESLKGTQDYTGRLWDVLSMAVTSYRVKRVQLRSEGRSPEEVAYELRIVQFHTLFQMAGKMIKEKLWLVFNEFEGFTITQPGDY